MADEGKTEKGSKQFPPEGVGIRLEARAICGWCRGGLLRREQWRTEEGDVGVFLYLIQTGG